MQEKERGVRNLMDTLTLEHISYQYKKADREVLKDVNCRFSSGEMAAVIGPSGSGKTTFLSILAGWRPWIYAGRERPHFPYIV